MKTKFNVIGLSNNFDVGVLQTLLNSGSTKGSVGVDLEADF